MPKNRRRAIHATLVRESKDNPGYFRYNITIKEKDGTIHDVPAYGKDMEDALERLVWNERIDSVAEKKATLPILVSLCLVVVALSGVLSAIQNEPLWIVCGISLVVFLALGINRIESYLNK
jgi:hypothetical protein